MLPLLLLLIPLWILLIDPHLLLRTSDVTGNAITPLRAGEGSPLYIELSKDDMPKCSPAIRGVLNGDNDINISGYRFSRIYSPKRIENANNYHFQYKSKGIFHNIIIVGTYKNDVMRLLVIQTIGLSAVKYWFVSEIVSVGLSD